MRALAHTLLYFYFLILLARLVLDWVQAFAAQWRPQGVLLVLAEGIYTVTDPPVKAVRRVVPVLRFGSVGIDLSIALVLIAVSLLLRII